jgi:hypothetical protein
MKRKIEISLETEELISIKARRSVNGFCRECGTQIEMLTAETAAGPSGLSERRIFRLIENGELHFIEAERVFICRNSIEVWTEILKEERSSYE